MKASSTKQPEAILPSLATKINKIHKAALEGYRKSLSAAMKAGNLLIKAKGACKHGEWLLWLKGKCSGITDREKFVEAFIASRTEEAGK